MSDNEEKMQTKNSSLEESSGDESSSEAAEVSADKEFSSKDGEPVNKPRKDSTSSSSSSSSSEDEKEDSEDESSVSKSEAASKSEEAAVEAVSQSSSSEAPQQQPDPQPRSRSVSVEEAAPVSPPAPAERKISVASSKDENEEEAVKSEDEVEELEAVAPVPVERKVSVPVTPASEEDTELTQDEVELSKRETVHLDEAAKAEVIAEVTRKSSTASSASSESEAEEIQEPEAVEAKPATIIEDVASKEESSSEDEMIHKTSHQERVESPLNGRRSANTNGGDVTKIYTSAVNNNNNKAINNNNIDKSERTKPTKDITQIYTQTIAKASPPASPRSAPRSRPATDITKLYTGKLESRAKTPDAAAEKLSPRKHNMSTAVDKDAIRRAYEDVRSDTSDTEWAVFKFDEGNRLGVTATGKDFSDFKSYFGTDDRGFGYIRIQTGDEMSKRAKFVLVTWVGSNVSVMKKAKMSTDKALMKDVIQNMSVELQLENHGEFSHDNFKMQVDKASGARYGTGVRDL